MNETSFEETLKNDALNEIRKKNPNRIIIDHLNINSIRSKFEMLKEVIGNKIDILLIHSAYRLDRTEHSGDLMLFVREDIPSKLLPNVNPSGKIENIFVEINLRSKKWLNIQNQFKQKS